MSSKKKPLYYSCFRVDALFTRISLYELDHFNWIQIEYCVLLRRYMCVNLLATCITESLMHRVYTQQCLLALHDWYICIYICVSLQCTVNRDIGVPKYVVSWLMHEKWEFLSVYTIIIKKKFYLDVLQAGMSIVPLCSTIYTLYSSLFSAIDTSYANIQW